MQSREIEVPVRQWQLLTRWYARLVATRWGYNVLGRALPSAVFLVGFLGGLDRVPEVQGLIERPSPGGVLALLQELLSRFLGLCLVVLFAIRKRPIGRPASLLGTAVALAATFFGAFVIFFNALGLRPAPATLPPALGVLTLSLGVFSAGMLVVSYVTLGRHMGILPEVRGLVMRGPYRYFRHPIYVAYLLGAGATLISTFSPQAVFIFLAYYALVAWRSALEEQVLEEVFGETYRRYRQRTIGLYPLRVTKCGLPRTSRLD
jgi:protein-S-isoprenylcysteine O-methyltransferase Ste14